MNIAIEYANEDHYEWLQKNDNHVLAQKMREKISNKQVLVAIEADNIIGWLRFGFFWDEIPFMNMLRIEENYRGKNIGRQLVSFWEKDMKKAGYKIVLTSTLSDERAQHFYRKIGYTDTGSLLLPKEALEIIFRKEL